MHGHDLTIRELLAEHHGIEVKQRGGGDGFSRSSRSRPTPSTAPSRSSSVSPNNATLDDLVPEIRIGVHEADALMSGNDFAGLGVHEAARIGAYAEAGASSPAHRRPRGWAHRPPRPTRGRVQGLQRSARDPGGPMARRAHRNVRGQGSHVALTGRGQLRLSTGTTSQVRLSTGTTSHVAMVGSDSGSR